MTNQASSGSQDLHNRGWGFALFIVILAIAVNTGVFMIHKKTYLAPPSEAAAHAPQKAAH